jgi:hypothetical protein
VSNIIVWFNHPFSWYQIISWVLLIVSIYVVLAGVILMKKVGKSRGDRADESLYTFEKTSELVQQGIFKYIQGIYEEIKAVYSVCFLITKLFY